MKWLSGIAFLLQLGWVFVGSAFTPDYYVRSPQSVQAWAYSRGLWVVVISVMLALLGCIAAYRLRTPKPVGLAVFSCLFAGLWLVYPYIYSAVGDAVYWRFP